MRTALGLFCLAFCAAAGDIDLLKIEAARPVESFSGFYPLGAMLNPYRGGYMWSIPEGSGSSVVKLSPVRVKPLTRYSLEWKLEPSQFMKILVQTRFPPAMPALHLLTFENSSAYMNLQKELITPTGADKMELEIVLFGISLKPKMNIGFMSSMILREIGPVELNPALEKWYGKNLLPVADFEKFEVGEKNRTALGMMPFGGKPFSAEVVKHDGRNVLRVNYTPGDFQYVTWFTPELPLYGSAAALRCRIRGKGRVQLMVWWNRPNFHTIFKHFGFFELTDEWKEYQIGIGCDDPLTQKAAAAVACRDNPAEFEISDISLVFDKPQSIPNKTGEKK